MMDITLTGADGSIWPLDGSRGVELRPGPKRLIDAPARTFWVQGAQRMHYQGRQFDRRDPTFAVTVVADNPHSWRDIDSAFRMALGMYDDQFRITVDAGGDVRHLDLRLLSEPTAYEQGDWEGRDPHLYAASTLLINAAAEQPFWYAHDLEVSWSTATGDESTTFDMQNRGDIEVWPRWFVTAPGLWTLPDYSWGQEIAHQRPPGADATRTVDLPELVAGEDCDVNTDPDEQPIVAANKAPVWARWDGNGLLYPIRARTAPTSVPVAVSGANPGAAVTLTIPQRFTRPLGVSL